MQTWDTVPAVIGRALRQDHFASDKNRLFPPPIAQLRLKRRSDSRLGTDGNAQPATKTGLLVDVETILVTNNSAGRAGIGTCPAPGERGPRHQALLRINLRLECPEERQMPFVALSDGGHGPHQLGLRPGA